MGENGAGKSTLMKVLSGAYPASSYEGEIWIDGVKQRFMNTKDAEDAGIAMIYQEISMHLDLSVAENIFLGKLNTRGVGKFVVDWKSVYADAAKFLERVGLDVSPKALLRNLSTSQMQLVAIARALVKDPKILVLDEPTSALTLAETERLMNILRQLRANGITCILISHKMDEIFEISDRITIMRDARFICTQETAKADKDDVVSQMVGRRITSYYVKVPVQIGGEVLRVENFTVPHPLNPKKNIVENVSFSLRKGEILGLAGLVGAGRSEVVNAIFGKIRRSNGKIFIDGKEVDIHSPKEAIANGIALITEDRKKDGLVQILSIRENATLASLKQISKNGVLNRRLEEEMTQKYYDEMNIRAQNMEVLVQTLSGGNQQKVVLEKWLMTRPRILIMDEPTRGIDVGAKAEIYKMMSELVSAGISIIMISSELPELTAMSDRLIVLAGGQVRAEFTDPAEFSTENILRIASGVA